MKRIHLSAIQTDFHHYYLDVSDGQAKQVMKLKGSALWDYLDGEGYDLNSPNEFEYGDTEPTTLNCWAVEDIEVEVKS